ncbi:PQQ-binding-like beta-propeller repeat protein, partial [Streptomyces tendae]
MTMRDVTSDGRTPGVAGFLSRRRVLRLAGGGLTLAALTTGAVGCDEDAVDVEEPGSAGGDVPGGDGGKEADADGNGNGQAPEPLWTKPTSAETYGDNDELVAAGGVVIASGSPLAAL